MIIVIISLHRSRVRLASPLHRFHLPIGHFVRTQFSLPVFLLPSAPRYARNHGEQVSAEWGQGSTGRGGSEKELFLSEITEDLLLFLVLRFYFRLAEPKENPFACARAIRGKEQLIFVCAIAIDFDLVLIRV